MSLSRVIDGSLRSRTYLIERGEAQARLAHEIGEGIYLLLILEYDNKSILTIVSCE